MDQRHLSATGVQLLASGLGTWKYSGGIAFAPESLLGLAPSTSWNRLEPGSLQPDRPNHEKLAASDFCLPPDTTPGNENQVRPARVILNCRVGPATRENLCTATHGPTRSADDRKESISLDSNTTL